MNFYDSETTLSQIYYTKLIYSILATILGLADRIDDCPDFGGQGPKNDSNQGGKNCPIQYHLCDNKRTNKTQEFDQDNLIVRRACTYKVSSRSVRIRY